MAATDTIILNETINDARNAEFLLEFITIRHCGDDKLNFAKTTKYLEKILKEKQLTVRYESATSSPYGRLYGNGIQNIPSNIRGFLCSGLTTDIDFKNCHPTILYYICKQHGIKCDTLTEYIHNRDELLNTLSTDLKKSRDDVKIKIIEAINDENNQLDTNENTFLKQFGKEIKKIQNILYNTDEYEWIVDEVKKNNKKQYNLKGSFISHVCCYTENIMLMSLYNFLIKKDYKVHSLMFDGLMIYGDHYDNLNLLKECNEHIKTLYGDLHAVTYKAHSTCYKIPEGYKTDTDKYLELKETFEVDNFKMADQYGNVKKSGVSLYHKSNFMILHEGFYDIKFLKRWFLDPTAKSYDNFGCYPNHNKCPDNEYNLWTPFDCVNYETAEDDVGLNWFLNHIRSMCNYEESVFNFVCMWLAQMLQFPEFKSVQIVFQAQEGTGKGLFLEFLRMILGNKKVYESPDPQNQIFGNQNGLLKNSYLVVFQEQEKSFFQKAMPKLKALITDPTIVIRELYQKPFEMNSYHRFIGFTNIEEQTLLARRQVFISGSSDKVNDTEYFKTGFQYANDKGIAKRIYDYFMEYPTKPNINNSDFPITEYHKELKELSIAQFDTWVDEELKQSNRYIDYTPVNTIYKHYKEWYEENGFNLQHICNVKVFSMKLSSTGFMKKTQKWVGEGDKKRYLRCWKST